MADSSSQADISSHGHFVAWTFRRTNAVGPYLHVGHIMSCTLVDELKTKCIINKEHSYRR